MCSLMFVFSNFVIYLCTCGFFYILYKWDVVYTNFIDFYFFRLAKHTEFHPFPRPIVFSFYMLCLILFVYVSCSVGASLLCAFSFFMVIGFKFFLSLFSLLWLFFAFFFFSYHTLHDCISISHPIHCSPLLLPFIVNP